MTLETYEKAGLGCHTRVWLGALKPKAETVMSQLSCKGRQCRLSQSLPDGNNKPVTKRWCSSPLNEKLLGHLCILSVTLTRPGLCPRAENKRVEQMVNVWCWGDARTGERLGSSILIWSERLYFCMSHALGFSVGLLADKRILLLNTCWKTYWLRASS